MKKGLLFLVALTAACGTDSPTAVPEAFAANSAGQSTAIVTVDGVQYEIGCPDYPCPVSQIVLDHIAQKMFFWMPPGTFKDPAIYLYVLRTPVLLHDVPVPSILPPPPVPVEPEPPFLLGPTSVQGHIVPPISQVTCGEFELTLVSPDGGPWSFVSGQVEYEYATYNAGTGTWVATGTSSVVGFNEAVWSGLLAGTHTLYPPFPNLDYWAHFAVTLARGTYQAEVAHTMLCAAQLPPPPPPPPPSLDGPVTLLGTRPAPQGYLTCSLDLTLISPDDGPWTFVDGQRLIEFISYDPIKKAFFKSGQTANSTLTSSDWQQLLDGTYSLHPGSRTGAFYATFSFTVGRDQYQHSISHTVVCGGPDYHSMVGPLAN